METPVGKVCESCTKCLWLRIRGGVSWVASKIAAHVSKRVSVTPLLELWHRCPPVLLCAWVPSAPMVRRHERLHPSQCVEFFGAHLKVCVHVRKLGYVSAKEVWGPLVTARNRFLEAMHCAACAHECILLGAVPFKVSCWLTGLPITD